MASKKARKQRGATKEQLAKRAKMLELPAPEDVKPARLYYFHPDSPVQLTERGRQELMAQRAAELVKGTAEGVTVASLVDPTTAVRGAVALLRLAGLKVQEQHVRGPGFVVTSILVNH